MKNVSNLVHMVVDTPGKALYERQVRYLLAGDADGLVESNYHDDALLVSPNFTVRGKAALREHFRRYLGTAQIKEVRSTDNFAETEETVLFEATVVTNRGLVRVYDAFVLQGGRIRYHFTGVK